MAVKKQWIQSATVGVDEESGALLMDGARSGFLVEKKTALPNAGHVEVDLGKVCHNVIIFLQSGASCQVSLLGIATADSPDIDDTVMPRIPVPQGTSQVSFYAAGDMHLKKATIWGW